MIIESRQVASRAMHSVAVIRMVAAVVVRGRRSSVVLTLDLSSLRSGLGEHGNVTAAVVVKRRVGKSKV